MTLPRGDGHFDIQELAFSQVVQEGLELDAPGTYVSGDAAVLPCGRLGHATELQGQMHLEPTVLPPLGRKRGRILHSSLLRNSFHLSVRAAKCHSLPGTIVYDLTLEFSQNACQPT